MTNLFDIIQNAQSGFGMENLAKQFNLNAQQAQSAVEAMLPAFSLGLKNQVRSPTPFAGLNVPNPDIYSDAAAAFTRQTAEQGAQALDTLFGSKDASKAVAQQVANLSGVANSIALQMMPVVASMLMTGLVRVISTNSTLQATYGQIAGRGEPAPNPFAGFQSWFPTAGAASAASPQAAPSNSFFDLILNAWQTPAKAAEPPPSPPAAQTPDFSEMLGQMFETGTRMHQTNVNAMQSILDTFLGKTPK